MPVSGLPLLIIVTAFVCAAATIVADGRLVLLAFAIIFAGLQLAMRPRFARRRARRLSR